MLAYGLTEQDLKESADSIGVICNISGKSGNALRFTLRWNPESYPDDPARYRHVSISWSGERKTRSACFHAHYDFIVECFKRNKHARIVSSYYGKRDYDGRVSFYRQVPDFAMLQIGAPIMGGYPCMIQSCECGGYGFGLKHGYPTEALNRLDSILSVRHPDFHPVQNTCSGCSNPFCDTCGS